MSKKTVSKIKLSGFLVALSILLIAAIVLIKSVMASFCANPGSCINDLSGEYREGEGKAFFEGSLVSVPQKETPEKGKSKVLAESSGFEKRIEVNLSNQTLYAFEGSRLVMSFPVSTGKWSRTPTGTFRIWIKLRYTRMKGGKPGTSTYYNLPNVPHTMYFYNDEYPKYRGYGLHGAYWHNNFGHPMSHGCVNIGLENAARLYDWAAPPSSKNVTYASEEDPGTVVIIYGETPKE